MAVFNAAFNLGRLKGPTSNSAGNAANTPGRGVIADRWKELAGWLAAGMIDQITITEDDSPVAAAGTVTLSSASGTITATINGVAIAVTAAGGDTNTAVLLAAAIIASVNPLVQNIVTATSALGVVTITSSRLGLVNNAITLAASGTGATASGARLTGGSNGTTTTIVF